MAAIADNAWSVLEGQADVVDAVLAASRVFVAVASNAIAETAPDVTLPQFRALVLLDIHGPMTVAHLAEALSVAPSTASRMCERLVAKKLIRRAVDRSNRRQVRLGLRAEGRALIAASTRRRRQEIARLLRAIRPADQARLAAALRVLVQAAQAEDRTRPNPVTPRR
ncbi:MAG TPA: MarR family transcriptional regulator [Streptosporangiaceae bacterium]|nr:MarR family transcriptional regulator [Streptosporangiaceae bacterium]